MIFLHTPGTAIVVKWAMMEKRKTIHVKVQNLYCLHVTQCRVTVPCAYISFPFPQGNNFSYFKILIEKSTLMCIGAFWVLFHTLCTLSCCGIYCTGSFLLSAHNPSRSFDGRIPQYECVSIVSLCY